MLALGLYEDAVLELRRHQRADGSSPVVEATIAWALGQNGDLRPSINSMRRAYPEFMAAGGEALPVEIRQAIFPFDHWELLLEYANAHDLDPYLMLALVAQESTFQADVRSPADAYGLMQIIPGTGRRMARTLGISSFRTSMLVEPEINVRMGMRYFSELLAEFGDPAPALASYNAGEHRVRVWLAERPGMARDEFVDDIPFPETQNYVKRILGTAEDYRMLYPELSPAHARSAGR
jgi:soluble lytic murein transglycosylase